MVGSIDIDTKRLVAADREPQNWMTIGRTYDEQRFSPLTQINDSNVGKLGLAWFYDLGVQNNIEGTPLVVDGVMYAISTWAVTVALNAATGEQIWRFDPEVSRSWGRMLCCDVVSRGLALWKDKVIIATPDGRLIALDSRSGKPVWSIKTTESGPYSITGAPRVFRNKVVIGNGGGELGVRGYVSAYDVNSGRLCWRFWTVPGNPSNGFENREMKLAAKTWHGQWWLAGGGGAVWDSIVYDPEFNRVYFGTGNGTPWLHKLRSDGKGDNLFLDSIVALNADTGEYIWHFQMIPADNWDFDVTQPIMLASIRIQKKMRQVILQAPKHGFFYVLDRVTGKLISAEKFIEPNDFASKVDIRTGRPTILSSAKYQLHRISMSPDMHGAHSWQPMSYNPILGFVYFPVLQSRSTYQVDLQYHPRAFDSNVGVTTALVGEQSGYLLAWDPVRQKEVWRVTYPTGTNGGTLSTAGNLVAEGTGNQTLAIYRATDGTKLWEMGVQTIPLAGPMTYSVSGEQYIAVSAGGVAKTSAISPQRSVDRILAFKLDANRELPTLLEARSSSISASSSIINPHEAQVGSRLYHEVCARCHGGEAISAGAFPDLRYMSLKTRAQFTDIVLKGVLAEQGMASFADILSEGDAQSIKSYLLKRASESDP